MNAMTTGNNNRMDWATVDRIEKAFVLRCHTRQGGINNDIALTSDHHKGIAKASRFIDHRINFLRFELIAALL